MTTLDNLLNITETLGLDRILLDLNENNGIRSRLSQNQLHQIQQIIMMSQMKLTTAANIYEDQQLDGIKIKIVHDDKSCIEAMRLLISFQPKCVGIDCEWNSLKYVCKECMDEYDYKASKLSLLQIAHPKIIILIRIHLLKTIPDILKTFLSNNNIIKTGVEIFSDIQKLKRYYKLHVYGCIDLNQIILKKLPQSELKEFVSSYEWNKCQKETRVLTQRRNFSLKILCLKVLHKHMKYKNFKFSRDWESARLSKEQILYSAEDAYIGYEIFMALTQIVLANSVKVDLNINDTTSYFGLYHEIIDVKFIMRGGKHHKTRKLILKQETELSEVSNSQSISRKSFNIHCIRFEEQMKNMNEFIIGEDNVVDSEKSAQLIQMEKKVILLQKEYSQNLMNLYQKQHEIISEFETASNED